MKDVRAARRRKRARKIRRIRHLVFELLIMSVCFLGLFLTVGSLPAGSNDDHEKTSVFERFLFRNGNGENDHGDPMNHEKPAESKKQEWMIEMEGISQDGIPTGCESVSTVMTLRYFGVEVGVDEFINTYLHCENFWKEGGMVFGPDPHECFAGNPYEKGSLGCFSGVIADAVGKMKSGGYPGMQGLFVDHVTGEELSELCNGYVADNIPVVVWVTIGMEEPYDGMEYYLEDGSRYVWKAREHCMVLCGFDEQNYYLMDPLSGGDLVCFERSLVEKRYEQMGKEAVVIRREK